VTRLQEKVYASLQTTGCCTLSVDGAEDQCKGQVSHVCALTPQAHFLGTIRFGTTPQTHHAILKELSPFRERLSGLNVEILGLVTDNEAKMKLARDLHFEMHGGCTPGCGPHAGNLIMGDVLKHEQVKDAVASAKSLNDALKNTKLRAFLKEAMGQGSDSRVGVPSSGERRS